MDAIRLRRPLIVLLSLAAVCAAGVFIFLPHRGELDVQLDALRRMGHPTSLAELFLRRLVDSAAEAAGAALEKALGGIQGDPGNLLSSPDFEAWRYPDRPWTDIEMSAAAVIRSNNLPALEVVHQALQAPAFRLVKNLPAGPAMTLPRVFGYIDAARTLTVAAGWEAQRGETSAASRHLADALELGRVLSGEPTMLVAIGSLATTSTALGGLENVVNQARLSEGELNDLQKELGRSWVTNITEQCLASETCFGLSIGDLAATQSMAFFGNAGPFSTMAGEWAVRASFALYSMSGLKRADFAFYTGHMVRNLEAVRRDPRLRSALLQTNDLAMAKNLAQHRWRRRYSTSLIPRVFSFWEGDLRNQIRNRAANAALAVERYRLAHGDGLPPSLDALVPEFLDRVPTDIFADSPLRYRRLDLGYVIYSIGPDQKDDGGSLLPVGDPSDVTFRVAR